MLNAKNGIFDSSETKKNSARAMALKLNNIQLGEIFLEFDGLPVLLQDAQILKDLSSHSFNVPE